MDARPAGPGGSGIGAFARSALNALAGSGRESLLAVTAGESARTAWPARVEVLAASPGPLWSELGLPVQLEESGADVFFSPLFICPVVRATRHVITLHDVFPESHPGLCTAEFLAFWKARIGPSLRSACHAVAVSEWSKAQAVEHLRLDPARVSVIHQSAGSRFLPVLRAEAEPVLARHALPWGGYVLCVGAVDPRKNLERLVKAFCRMAGDGLVLVLAGSETVKGYGGQVRQSANSSGGVKFLGYVPEKELPSLYSGARCFAFPSLAEGFGRPCVEAMACGVPVVASSATALPETCGEGALLPDPESEEAIAEALNAACFNETERSRLVEAGRRRAAAFSAERFAAELIKAFEAALAGPREGLWSG